MQASNILKQLGCFGIIPVVVIDTQADAGLLADALMEGGLPAMEITFRTDAARAVIMQIARTHPSILLGAGTVLTVDQAKTAIDCGANFIVSPGLNPAVVEYCLRNEVTIIPGVITPTEITTALSAGVEVVKFFPAEASGGVEYLKAVSAPFRTVKYIPTGGINESNVVSYLRIPSVIACGGSWMVKNELIRGKRFDEIKRLTSDAVRLVSGMGRDRSPYSQPPARTNL